MSNLPPTVVQLHEQQKAAEDKLRADIDAFIQRVNDLMDRTVNQGSEINGKSVVVHRRTVNYRPINGKPRMRTGKNAKMQAIDVYEQPVLDSYKPATADNAEPTGRFSGVFCFIALCDHETASLGKVKQGDVMKAATWKAPAKHARGNIYDAHGGMQGMQWTGPAYLT